MQLQKKKKRNSRDEKIVKKKKKNKKRMIKARQKINKCPFLKIKNKFLRFFFSSLFPFVPETT